MLEEFFTWLFASARRTLTALAVIVAVAAPLTVMYFNTERHVTATVTDKQPVCDSHQGSCYYLVWTTQGTFKNTDSAANLKWDSSDLYGQIKIGDTDEFQVRGWRIGVLSKYPNILSLVRVVQHPPTVQK